MWMTAEVRAQMIETILANYNELADEWASVEATGIAVDRQAGIARTEERDEEEDELKRLRTWEVGDKRKRTARDVAQDEAASTRDRVMAREWLNRNRERMRAAKRGKNRKNSAHEKKTRTARKTRRSRTNESDEEEQLELDRSEERTNPASGDRAAREREARATRREQLREEQVEDGEAEPMEMSEDDDDI